MIKRFLLVIICTCLSATAVAAPPANDLWENRTAIGTLPFSTTVTSVVDATLSDSDPRPFCRGGASSQGARSLWFSITPASEEFLNVSGSGYDTMIAVYTGTPGSFAQVFGGCNDDGLPAFGSRVAGVRLSAGVEYSIYVAQFNGISVPGNLSFLAARAPQYAVTQTADRAGPTCAAGNCSLREAISAANANPGVVVVPSGSYTLSLAGASEDLNATGDLDVRSGYAIYGAGAELTTISAAGLNDRVLHVDPSQTAGHSLILSGLRLSDGNVSGDGGAINNGTNGNEYLALDRVQLRNHRASINGGALRTASIVEIRASEIDGNDAASNGGALYLQGGADTRTNIVASTFSNNLARGNFAGGGGAIYTTTGSTLIESSTLSGNRSNFAGGGVLATTSSGGLLIRYSTLANNIADADATDSSEGGGVRYEGGVSTTLIGNLLADNRTDGAAGAFNDCSISPSAGPFATGSNFVRTVGNCEFNSSGDIVGLDARLGSLRLQGGLTRTHLPAFRSAAIDGQAQTCPTIDQRGVTRPLDGNADGDANCDFGAAESDVLFADGVES
jgi:CSLREA domain-containing protein